MASGLVPNTSIIFFIVYKIYCNSFLPITDLHPTTQIVSPKSLSGMQLHSNRTSRLLLSSNENETMLPDMYSSSNFICSPEQL